MTDALPDKEAKESFEQAQCFLISKKLSTKGHFFLRYRADFLISYNVNGVQYSRWVSGNGLNRGFVRNEIEQEEHLSQFEVGGTYPCWYSPDLPQRVILIFRNNWFSIFPFMLPATIFIFTFYYFIKKCINLFNHRLLKSRKK